MKKLISVLLIVAMLCTTLFAVTACGGGGGRNETVYKYVTYNSMGGTAIGVAAVEENTTAAEPVVPYLRNYIFKGWFTDEECTEGAAFDFTTPITADITLYAKWEAKPVIVLESIALSGAIEVTNYVDAESIDLTGLSITKTLTDETTSAVELSAIATNWNEIKTSAGEKTLVISYTEGTVTKTSEIAITVSARPVEPLVLDSISISGSISAINYVNAENVNLTGISIIAKYDDNSTATIALTSVTTNWATIKDGEGAKTLQISYQEGGVTKTAATIILVTAKTVLQGNFDVPEVGYDGSAVTIKFYHTMGANLRTVLTAYIEDFKELYPNITIEESQVGGYDDVRNQISTEISVGNQPNMAYCYPDHVALYNLAGKVATLDSLIESTIEVTRADGSKEILGLTQEQIDDFIEAYYNEGKQFGDGLMYSMPFSKSTEVLYYNKTFFDANNLTVPTTWGEMEVLCARILEIDPYAIPLGYDSEANWFITMCEQYGSDYTSATGDHFIFNNAENRRFIKYFRGWYENGYVTTQELLGAYTSSLFTKVTSSSDPIRSYMSIGSSAGATHQRPGKDANGNWLFDVGIAPIPQVNPDDPKVISQGPSICIFKKDNPQEVVASWLFLKFLITSVDFQAEFSIASGYVPVLKSVAEHSVYKAKLEAANGGDNISMLSAKVCLEQEDYYYVSPAFNGSSKARDEVGTLMSKCLVGNPASGQDVDTFILKAFEDAVAECVAKFGK